jgi:hypothetical protein
MAAAAVGLVTRVGSLATDVYNFPVRFSREPLDSFTIRLSLPATLSDQGAIRRGAGSF